MEDQLGALGLILNCIVLWNTRYMNAALDQLRAAQGYLVLDEDVARLSPFARDHLNVVGNYTFALPDLGEAGVPAATRPGRGGRGDDRLSARRTCRQTQRARMSLARSVASTPPATALPMDEPSRPRGIQQAYRVALDLRRSRHGIRHRLVRRSLEDRVRTLA